MLLNVAYTMPGEPGSFGGERHPFVERFVCRKVERYLHTQEAHTLQKQVKRHFPHRNMLLKGIISL